MLPNDFICSRIRLDDTLEINIVSFFDVFGIQIGAQLQLHGRYDC
jgi:hypothetical protein